MAIEIGATNKKKTNLMATAYTQNSIVYIRASSVFMLIIERHQHVHTSTRTHTREVLYIEMRDDIAFILSRRGTRRLYSPLEHSTELFSA